jgi:MYXO-CTERM domain-containing protein
MSHRVLAMAGNRASKRAVAVAASLCLILGGASVALADAPLELISEHYTLIAPTLSGGGAVDLESTAPSPSIGFAGATIGQSSPLGISSSDSGMQLESGFWPIVAPEPSSTLLALAAVGTLAALRRRRGR